MDTTPRGFSGQTFAQPHLSAPFQTSNYASTSAGLVRPAGTSNPFATPGMVPQHQTWFNGASSNYARNGYDNGYMMHAGMPNVGVGSFPMSAAQYARAGGMNPFMVSGGLVLCV